MEKYVHNSHEKYQASHHFRGLLLISFLDNLVHKIYNNKLYSFILLVPLTILFWTNIFNNTLFTNDIVHRGFMNDYPALWLICFGIVFMPILLSRYSNILILVKLKIFKYSKERFALTNHKVIKNIILSIALIFISYFINHCWVVSQLNDHFITWATLNGNIHLSLFPATIEGFNSAGLFYLFLCIIFWYLFSMAIILFLSSVISFFVYFIKSKSISNFKNMSSNSILITLYIRYSTLVVAMVIFYYVSLQINDIIVEGYNTFEIHPNRFMLYVLSVVAISAYILVTTILFFRTSSSNPKHAMARKSLLISEVKFDFFLILTPILILALHYIFINTIFKNETYKFKLALTFIVFLMSLVIIIFNQFEKRRRSLQYELLSNENQLITTYAQTINDLYQEMRHYKHDIKNILLGLRTYIEDEKYSDLKAFFYEEIINQAPLTNPDYQLLSQVARIDNLPLKGLILSKFNYISTNEISLNLEIISIPAQIPLGNIDLCRIIGILIDNAMEAAVTSEDKKVLFSMCTEENRFEITIGNSYKDSINLDVLYKLNYSSKGVNRGTGLHSVRTLLKANPSAKIVTNVTKEWFLQKITIDIETN